MSPGAGGGAGGSDVMSWGWLPCQHTRFGTALLTHVPVCSRGEASEKDTLPLRTDTTHVAAICRSVSVNRNLLTKVEASFVTSQISQSYRFSSR